MGMSDKVRYNVQMPEDLREDAKRNAKRGELAEEVRSVFRRIAYGEGASRSPSELEKAKNELQEVRAQIDSLRHERTMLESKIQTKESRATRLEERIENLERENDELETKMEMLENMLHEGKRLWPTVIKNTADVDEGTAQKLYEQLRERNAELPEEAFNEPDLKDPNNWKKGN